jgi:hypothetical protein
MDKHMGMWTGRHAVLPGIALQIILLSISLSKLIICTYSITAEAKPNKLKTPLNFGHIRCQNIVCDSTTQRTVRTQEHKYTVKQMDTPLHIVCRPHSNNDPTYTFV